MILSKPLISNTSPIGPDREQSANFASRFPRDLAAKRMTRRPALLM